MDSSTPKVITPTKRDSTVKAVTKTKAMKKMPAKTYEAEGRAVHEHTGCVLPPVTRHTMDPLLCATRVVRWRMEGGRVVGWQEKGDGETERTAFAPGLSQVNSGNDPQCVSNVPAFEASP